MYTDDHISALGVANPYDHIDVGWVEQRLNEQAGVRRSRLAAYFDGYMEFTEQPPTLSRSPSPEPQDQSQHVRPALDSSRRRSTDKGGAARLPRRRGTFESDSDATDIQQPRKRRQVTPVPRRKVSVIRYLQPRKRPTKSNTASGAIPSAHRMETRSKSRRISRAGYSGVSKARSPRRKAS